MKKRRPGRTASSDLRRRAEARVPKARTQSRAPLSNAKLRRLLHELEVHKIELELQNEELRLSRLAVEAGLERYTELFDFAPIGYATLDTGGVIRELNHAGARLLGFERARLTGTSFAARVLPTDQHHIAGLLGRAADSGQRESTELEVLRDDGTSLPLHISATALSRGDAAFLLAFEDVTEQRRRELILKDEDRRKDEFLAVLGHELRTPLVPILLWSRALLEGGVALGDSRRALEVIVESAESQHRLVNDLLDVSRIRSGHLTLTRVPTDLKELGFEMSGMFRPLALRNGIDLTVDVAPALGRVMIDPHRFRQISWNLLSNAVKFTPSGGRVTMRLERVEGQLQLQVLDSGPGVAAELLPELFRRPRPARPSGPASQGGLGLGLALTQQLVEMHRGTISVQSTPGKGSVFTVSLPWVEPGPETTTAAVSPQVTASLRGLRVMLIEDDAQTREAMAWALNRSGAAVQALSNAEEALAVIRKGGADAPEVLLCDLSLPGMSGYEFLRQVTNHCRARGKDPIPAAAVSAHVLESARQQALQAGFDIFVPKPASAEVLLGALEELAAIARRDVAVQ